MQACVETVRAPISSPPGSSSWADDLREVIADLRKLNGSTETDFLAIGGKLMAFLSASRGLHTEIARLTALVSGEEVQHACDSLVSVRRYVREIQLRSAEGAQPVRLIQAGAERIRRGFSTFGEIATSFRITAILARIEVAHLTTSQQNLKNLADDVLVCSDSIGARAEGVLEVSVTFDARIGSTLREVARIEGIQLHDLPSLLAAVDADVEIFQARQRETADISAKLAAELEAVTRDLGAVATSIQFHDITRQQVEHVIEALDRLVPGDPSSPLSSSAADLIRLQKAHLQNAAAAFAASTGRIDNDLAGISRRVDKMAAATTTISGGSQGPDNSHKENDSSLFGMEGRVSAIAGAVTQLDSLARTTRTNVADLRGVSHGLDEAVNEVQLIESQLGRISINAVISANHIGAPGEALIAIAGAIRELRAQSVSRSVDAKEALHSIGTAIDHLAGGDVATAGDSAASALLEDLNTRVADLQAARCSSAVSSANIAALALSLCGDLQEARGHIAIGALFAETADHCRGLLDAVVSRAELPDHASDTQFLDEEHRKRYTMQAEHDVHAALVGGTAYNPLAENALPAGDGDVEFF